MVTVGGNNINKIINNFFCIKVQDKLYSKIKFSGSIKIKKKQDINISVTLISFLHFFLLFSTEEFISIENSKSSFNFSFFHAIIIQNLAHF